MKIVLTCLSGLLSLLVMLSGNSYYYSGMGSEEGMELKNVSVIQYIGPRDSLARGEGGWGYTPPLTTLFNTDSSSVNSTDKVKIIYAGDHKFSGSLWIRPFEPDGLVWSWGDTEKKDMTELKIVDRHVVLERMLGDSLYQVETAGKLNLFELSYIKWSSEVKGDSIIQKIFINNELSENQRNVLHTNIAYSLVSSKVQLGGISRFGTADSIFTGEIMGASFQNVNPNNVNDEEIAWLPYDGSAYLGMTNYWAEEHTKEYNIPSTEVATRVFTPYQHDDFVPQGITNIYEDPNSFDQETGMIYVALYNKTVEGYIRRKKSIIAELDPANDYKVRRCFRLQGDNCKYGHNGGIAFQHNSIYVATGGKVEVYPLPEYSQENAEKYVDLTATSAKLYDVLGEASFTTIYNDTLWTGSYVLESDNQVAYIYGHALGSDGSIKRSKVYYRIPFQVQGAAWTSIQNKDYLFLSISAGGTNNSKILRYDRSELSLFREPEADTIFEVPSGGEDLTFDKEGDIWTVSESSSRYYQLRESSPWKQFFPFVFEIKREILEQGIPVNSNDINQKDEIVPEAFGLKCFPNPFNGSMTISYTLDVPSKVKLSIYDIKGNKVDEILKNTVRSAGTYKENWTNRTLPSGVYFVHLHEYSGNSIVNKVLYLK